MVRSQRSKRRWGGNIYVVDTGLREVVRIRPGGTLERVAPGLALTAPVSAVADAQETLYIADAGDI